MLALLADLAFHFHTLFSFHIVYKVFTQQVDIRHYQIDNLLMILRYAVELGTALYDTHMKKV